MEKEQIIAQLTKAQTIIANCLEALDGVEVPVSINSRGTKKEVIKSKPSKIDFTLNERNFVKNYGSGLSGPKKFVLLLAYSTKGKLGQDVEVGVVMAKWSKMKSKDLLGAPYNGKYATVAKTNGWIDSKKYGTYQLHSSWMNIFS